MLGSEHRPTAAQRTQRYRLRRPAPPLDSRGDSTSSPPSPSSLAAANPVPVDDDDELQGPGMHPQLEKTLDDVAPASQNPDISHSQNAGLSVRLAALVSAPAALSLPLLHGTTLSRMRKKLRIRRPPKTRQLAPSSRATYEATFPVSMRALAAAQRGRVNAASFSASRARDAQLPPSHKAFSRARRYLMKTRPRSFLRNSLFAFDRLMREAKIDKLLYYSLLDRAQESIHWRNLELSNPVKHARVVHLRAWAEYLSASGSKARHGYRLLRESTSEDTANAQLIPELRLAVQDVRNFCIALCALSGAWRKSDLLGAHLSTYHMSHAWTFLMLPGNQIEFVIRNPKGGGTNTSVISSPSSVDQRHLDLGCALGMWLRVAVWTGILDQSFRSQPAHDTLVQPFVTCSTQLWGTRLSDGACAKILAAILNDNIGPIYERELALNTPSQVPAPSYTCRRRWSSHSWRHSGITLLSLSRVDSNIIRFHARDKQLFSLDPYLQQAPVADVLASARNHPDPPKL